MSHVSDSSYFTFAFDLNKTTSQEKILIKGMDCAGCLEARTRDRRMRFIADALECTYSQITDGSFPPEGMTWLGAFEEIEAVIDSAPVESASRRKRKGPRVIVEQGQCDPDDDAQLWDLISMDSMDVHYMFENHETGECLTSTGCDWCQDEGGHEAERNLGGGGRRRPRITMAECDDEDPRQVWAMIGGHIMNYDCYWNDESVNEPFGGGRDSPGPVRSTPDQSTSLINTPLVSDKIRKGEVHELKELMARSTEHGMQTFDLSSRESKVI